MTYCRRFYGNRATRRIDFGILKLQMVLMLYWYHCDFFYFVKLEFTVNFLNHLNHLYCLAGYWKNRLTDYHWMISL